MIFFNHDNQEKYPMNSVFKTFMLLCILFVSVQYATAADRRREELEKEEAKVKVQQELAFYQKQLEEVRVNRWQDKRNAVSKKEVFQEAWNELRRDVDKLALTKTQKEESMMRLQNQVEIREREVEELRLRRREFGIQVTEKLAEYEREIRSAFPVKRDALREEATTLKVFVEKNGYRPGEDIFRSTFALHDKQFQVGESRELVRTRFPVMGLAQAKAGLPANAGTRLVAGYQIRLGSVYSSFVSTEGPDVAILGKTGKLQENAWTWLEDLQSKDREVLQAASSKLASQSENVIMLPVDVQLRKATGAGYTAGEGVAWYKELLNELKGAGFVIYLLGVILFIGLSILTDKMIVFFTRGRNTRRFAEKVIKEIESGRDEKALSMCRKAQGSVPLVMGAILKNRRKGRGAAEDNAYEVMLIEGAAIEKRISTINILAAAAPLVGLLGTVSGMVNLFSAITMHGTNDPKIMAAGIGEALLSTKWGLLVAIPMLLLYNFISNKATALISDIEKYSAKTINTVFGPPDENDEDGRQQMIAEKDRNDSGALPKEDNKPNTNEGGAEPLNA